MADRDDTTDGHPRHGRIWTILGACLVLVAAVVVLVRINGGGNPQPEQCEVAGADGSAVLSQEQMANAATITAVGMKGLSQAGLTQGLPHRAIVIALATALQESKLENLSSGDRDSVGLFQQRPTQGWGTVAQIMDPTYASGQFYAHLAEVPGALTVSSSGHPNIGEAAQAVQRSADSSGASYEAHAGEATALEAGLSGAEPAAVTCEYTPIARASEQPGTDGFTARADAVWSALSDQFGFVVTRASVTGASASGMPPAASGDGRTISLDYPASDGDEVQRGWAVASWAVAQSASLGIAQVSYDGRTWTAADSGSGWRTAATATAGASASGDHVVITVA